MQASVIVNRAAQMLLDESGRVWPPEQLLGHLSAAQRAVVKIKPQALTETTVMQLQPGAKQEAPGLILHRVTRNMGTDGKTPGRAVRRVDEAMLTRFNPNWAADRNARDSVQHWMRNDQEPHVFYVDPPNTGNGHVEVNYAAAPAELSSETDELALSDDWEPALTHYVISAALGQETDGQSWQASQMHHERFLQLVTGSAEARMRWDPTGAMKRQQGATHG
ncbi:DUF6682 family protein [Thioalkalivibrio sp. ARh3]|uniref:phage adaptor protein n=1 Tax=Thioalkalivibrio sp. ARh3 TaxID=1158148 RepID=UPI000377FB83|nr:DUF6682 family protein [Thioalkalivibrio sp. ARh3]